MPRTFTLPGLTLLAVFFVPISGCGSPTKGTITGQVTLDGQRLARGYVVVGPLETTGSQHGADVRNGVYRITNVTPGKVRMIANVELEGPAGNISSGDALKIATQKAPELVNNSREVTITTGDNKVDFELKTKK